MDETISREHGAKCDALHELIGRMGERWTLPVASMLRTGPARFNAIRRALPGISQQMLTRTLKMLERDGMVIRTVVHSTPPQVEYALTTLGASLVTEGLRLGAWAHAHLSEVDSSRAAYDRIGEAARRPHS